MRKIYFILSLFIGATAFAAGGIEGGNGGAGIDRNGRYMTFYSAGLYTEPQPISGVGPDVIPGVDALIAFAQQFPYWSAQEKSFLINAAMPSSTHEYYKVLGDQFGAQTKARLLAEFARVTGQPVQSLELFAVTDTQKRQTFLLPAFYSLSTADQVAIMFHENYWLLFPNADYNTVVAAEMAFQAVFSAPTDPARIMDLLSKYGDSDETLQVMAKEDQASGALKGLLTAKGIPMAQLLGDAVVHCKGNTCVPGMVPVNLYHLVQQYPKSLILRQIWQASQNDYDTEEADGCLGDGKIRDSRHDTNALVVTIGEVSHSAWFEFDPPTQCVTALNLKNLAQPDYNVQATNISPDTWEVDLASCYLSFTSVTPGTFELNCSKTRNVDYVQIQF
jgi:hypothetical protein